MQHIHYTAITVCWAFAHPMENAHVTAEGDLAAIQMPSLGTFTGEFMGIPGNGNPVTISMINLWCVKDGKVVEGWRTSR